MIGEKKEVVLKTFSENVCKAQILAEKLASVTGIVYQNRFFYRATDDEFYEYPVYILADSEVIGNERSISE